MKRIIVGISGSSGAIYGARLVEVLSKLGEVETHLIVSRGARATIAYETEHEVEDLEAMADRVYQETDVGAGPASGTFLTDGMVVAPCSIKTLSAIATGYADTLLTRAADVCLKERRRLVLVVRETPLHLGHLRLMENVTEAGAVVLPPVPGFYLRPQTIGELVDHTVTKILDQFGIDARLIRRWEGLQGHEAGPAEGG
ncbi:MAG: UbiX family flavin prenyltransferase [Acidimicrobiia bacterium]